MLFGGRCIRPQDQVQAAANPEVARQSRKFMVAEYYRMAGAGILVKAVVTV